MKVLLDTHTFLWLMVDDPKLSITARKTFTDSNNEIYLNIASGWEMAIKSSIQKLKLPRPDYIKKGISENLPILSDDPAFDLYPIKRIW